MSGRARARTRPAGSAAPPSACPWCRGAEEGVRALSGVDIRNGVQQLGRRALGLGPRASGVRGRIPTPDS